MTPDQLRHLDNQFARVHTRLDVQDLILRDLGQRTARIEGGDAARAAMQLSHMPKPSPPARRMPRWQRVTLSVAAWAATIATTLGGAWAFLKPLFTAAPKS